MTKRNRWLVPSLVLLLCVAVAGGLIVWAQTRTVAPQDASGAADGVRTSDAHPIGETVTLGSLAVTVSESHELLTRVVPAQSVKVKLCATKGVTFPEVVLVSTDGSVAVSSQTTNPDDPKPRLYEPILRDSRIASGQCRDGYMVFLMPTIGKAAELRVQASTGEQAAWTLT